MPQADRDVSVFVAQVVTIDGGGFWTLGFLFFALLNVLRPKRRRLWFAVRKHVCIDSRTRGFLCLGDVVRQDHKPGPDKRLPSSQGATC